MPYCTLPEFKVKKVPSWSILHLQKVVENIYANILSLWRYT